MKFILVIGENLIEDITSIVYHFHSNDIDTVTFPENDKHPWEHMKFLEEYISELNVNNKNGCIITNSAYIIDHLSNLIIGHKYKDKCAKFLLNKDLNSFIDPNNVEVYEYKECQFIDILEDKEKGSINWDSVAEPANWVSKTSFVIAVNC